MSFRKFFHCFFGFNTRTDQQKMSYMGRERRKYGIRYQLQVVEKETKDALDRVKHHSIAH